MKKIFFGLAIVGLFALSGCVTTPSKPRTFDQLGQFSNTPLNNKTYRISFVADSNMSYGTAEEITLVKAAQTTLKNNFRFFKVMDDPSNRAQKPPRQAIIYPTPPIYGPGYYRRHPAFWNDPFFNTPQVVNVESAQVSYTIECFEDQKSAPPDAFDAKLILQSLGQKYGLSATGDVLQP